MQSNASVTVAPYVPDDRDAVVEFVLDIQQSEFFVPITLGDQPDLANIPAFYQRRRGGFWVAKRGAKWFIAGWAPAIYRVPDRDALTELCLRLLRGEGSRAYGDFDEAIRRDFALEPVSDHQEVRCIHA